MAKGWFLSLQQQLRDDLYMHFTAFYRDIRDWVGPGYPIDTYKGLTYYKWDNEKPGLAGEQNNEYIFYVLAGKGSIWVGDIKTDVSEGNFVFLPIKTSWKAESSHEQPLRHLLLKK